MRYFLAPPLSLVCPLLAARDRESRRDLERSHEAPGVTQVDKGLSEQGADGGREPQGHGTSSERMALLTAQESDPSIWIWAPDPP